jgi:aminopeptidase YwaD
LNDLRDELARVTGAIWTSDRMATDLAEICSYGSRFAGSEGERRTRSHILERLHAAGLANVRTWGFDYLGWERGECRLQALDDERDMPAISLVGSPSTEAKGLEAEVVDLGYGSRADFERHRDGLHGRIAMVSSGAPPGERTVHRRAKYGWAVERGAAGFLQMNHLPGLLPLTGSLRPDRSGEIPAASVSHEAGTEIRRRSRRGALSLRLTIHNQFRRARAEHVFADIPGASDETIILGAHYDGHDISPSALDNGSGLVTTLELARLLAPLSGRLRRTVRIAFWTVEEWALVGSGKYARSLSSDERRRIALVVNLDTTSGLGPLSWAVNGFTELTPRLRHYRDESGLDWDVREDVLTNSDHFSFLLAGVPAIWLQGTAAPDTTPRRYVLTAADTLDKVSSREMKEAATIAAQVVLRAANDPEPLARHYTPEEVREMLRVRGMQPLLEAQGEWPDA